MAYEFYVKITGESQGEFKGEAMKARHEDKIAGLAYSHKIDAPRDAATGQPSGARRHYPITFAKEWGVASPQLMQALITNELLDVVFEFEKTDAAQMATYYKITLEGATVTEIKYSTGGDDSAGSVKTTELLDTHELEFVSLTYRKIVMEHVLGSTASEDDWAQR